MRGWPLVKKFIELAKGTEVVTLSPEQRARLLEWARRQTLIEPGGQVMSEGGAQRGEAEGRGERSAVEHPLRAAEGRRERGGRRGAGLFPFPRATPAR